MAFMGELADVPVPDLLFILGQRRLTGRLLIQLDGEEVHVYLRHGSVAMVTSSLPTLRLGHALLRDGLITPDILAEALHIQENTVPARRLGDIVVECGWVDAVSLAACVENQSIDVIARVVSAEGGTFLFSRDVPLPATSSPLDLRAERLVLEATRRRDEHDYRQHFLAMPPDPVPAHRTVDAPRPFEVDPAGWGHRPSSSPTVSRASDAGDGSKERVATVRHLGRNAATEVDGDEDDDLPVGEDDPEYGTSRLSNSILSTRRRRGRRLTRSHG